LTRLVKAASMKDMATQVNLYEAKTHLSELVERAANGEEIVIAKSGRPRVRLVPISTRSTPRHVGTLRGKIVVRKDFDEPLTELFERP
jgi:prevent-host-death family protein